MPMNEMIADAKAAHGGSSSAKALNPVEFCTDGVITSRGHV